MLVEETLMLPLDEYQAIRTGTGIVDRSIRGRVALRGQDRLAYLHGLLTNDILALKPGHGCYSAYLTPQGRMITDMSVLEIEGMTLLDVPSSIQGRLVQMFDMLVFTEDVQVVDLTSGWTSIGIYGPSSAGKLAAVFNSKTAVTSEQQLLALREHDNIQLVFEEEAVVVTRTNETGLIGFHTFFDRQLSDRFIERLRNEGATTVCADIVKIFRIEMGRPEFGVDMDETTIPLEADIQDRAISTTKGCYVGQEVIIRVLHRGHGRVVRKLVGLVLDEAVPIPGSLIKKKDKDVGQVTSAVFSPALGKPIALGYVHRDFVNPGTVVDVVLDGHRQSATVTRLPFCETAAN